jgi:hypothetical protein
MNDKMQCSWRINATIFVNNKKLYSGGTVYAQQKDAGPTGLFNSPVRNLKIV